MLYVNENVSFCCSYVYIDPIYKAVLYCMIMLQELNNKLDSLLDSLAIHTKCIGVELSEDEACTRRKAYKYCTNIWFSPEHPIFRGQAFIMYGSNDVYKPVIIPVHDTNIFFELQEKDCSVELIGSNDIMRNTTFSSDTTNWTLNIEYQKRGMQYTGFLRASKEENKGCLKSR
jgi:hypothetical protein